MNFVPKGFSLLVKKLVVERERKVIEEGKDSYVVVSNAELFQAFVAHVVDDIFTINW